MTREGVDCEGSVLMCMCLGLGTEAQLVLLFPIFVLIYFKT